MRFESRERIVGDLGTRRGDHREQCALAGVGLAEQADVGDELQDQLEAPLFAFASRFPFARRLMCRRREVLVAAPAAATLGDEQRPVGVHELAEDFAGIGVADFRAGRDGEVDVVGGLPRHVFSLPVLAPVSAPMRVVAIVEEGREIGIDLYENASARSTITPIRSSLGHKFLPSE